MKIRLSLLLGAFVSLAPALFGQQTVSEAMTEAQRAYYRGDLETAKQKFMEVLSVDPRNVAANNFLNTIRIAQQQKGSGGDQVERQLRGLIIPKLELREATFG